MCDIFTEVAREQIDQADLPSTVYRTARKLLDRAVKNGGNVSLSEVELQQICGTDAEGTMRSHLVQMAKAEIIRYSRRGTVFIQFEAWANPELPWGDDEKVIAGRSNRALSDQNGADSLIRVRAGALVGCLVDPNPNQQGKKQTNNHTRKLRSKPTVNNEAHQQLALGLLIHREVGIEYQLAQIVAAKVPILDIYKLVDDWLPDHREGKVKTGLLVTKLAKVKPSDVPTVTLSVGFRSSDLYRRFPLPAEMVVDPERRNYSLYSTYDARAYNRPEDYTDIFS